MQRLQYRRAEPVQQPLRDDPSSARPRYYSLCYLQSISPINRRSLVYQNEQCSGRAAPQVRVMCL